MTWLHIAFAAWLVIALGGFAWLLIAISRDLARTRDRETTPHGANQRKASQAPRTIELNPSRHPDRTDDA